MRWQSNEKKQQQMQPEQKKTAANPLVYKSVSLRLAATTKKPNNGFHDLLVQTKASMIYLYISFLDYPYHGRPWYVPHVIPSPDRSPLSGGFTWHTFFFAFPFFQNRITVHPMMMM